MSQRINLREFLESDIRTLSYVRSQLETALGKLYQIGGEDRVYKVGGTNQMAKLYEVGTSLSVIGLAYSKNKIETIYWWSKFNMNEPDYAIDIPANGDFSEMLPTIAVMLHNKKIGKVDINEK